MKTHLTASALIVLAAKALAQAGAHKHSPNFVSGVGGEAREFVGRAAQGARLQIEAGKLAVERSDREKTRQFARRMIEDYTQRLSELERCVSSGGLSVTLATGLDEARQDAIDKLAGLEGKAFDKEYEVLELAARREAAWLLGAYVETGDSADLKAFASKALRRLQEHVAMAQDLKK